MFRLEKITWFTPTVCTHTHIYMYICFMFKRRGRRGGVKEIITQNQFQISIPMSLINEHGYFVFVFIIIIIIPIIIFIIIIIQIITMTQLIRHGTYIMYMFGVVHRLWDATADVGSATYLETTSQQCLQAQCVVLQCIF